MAYRKTLLHHRIKQQAANHQTVMAGQHPAVASVTPTPTVMPLAQVTVNPVDDNYVTLAMQELAPITTADGAMVPATGPGKWDQLALAGGGRHG
jgi:hypothetical protein